MDGSPPGRDHALLHGRGALEVLGRGRDVLLNRLLGEIDHMGGEKGVAVRLEEFLVGIELYPVSTIPDLGYDGFWKR